MTFGIYTFQEFNFIIKYRKSEVKKIFENKKLLFGLLVTLVVFTIIIVFLRLEVKSMQYLLMLMKEIILKV